MSFADSILQTASMARWVSVAVMATDQTIFDPPVQATADAADDGVTIRCARCRLQLREPGRRLLDVGREVRELHAPGESRSSRCPTPGQRDAHSIASSFDFT